MPNEKTDKQGYAAPNADEERDLGSKGGPALGLGDPADKHRVTSPYSEDLQTQIAVKSSKKNNNDKDQKEEGQ